MCVSSVVMDEAFGVKWEERMASESAIDEVVEKDGLWYDAGYLSRLSSSRVPRTAITNHGCGDVEVPGIRCWRVCVG